MRARWVLTWKSTGKAKARLCVLGFQDPDLTEVLRDSPTLSAASEALTDRRERPQHLFTPRQIQQRQQ